MSAPYEGTGLEIAIIGMSCQVPGAASLEAFWANLREGVESISFFRDEELREAGVPADLLSRPDYVKAAGVLGDVARFDAAFFGCTPREAQVIDPQQRLFLERAWEALERAGYDPAGYPGAVGVYGGSSTSGYLYALLGHPGVRAVVSLYELGLATEKDFLATRVAYKLGLEGPAVTVQTACSTSLVAVHLACQSLLAGECDLALAGGVAVQVPEKAGYVYEPDGIGSRDGHTRAFDAAASGTVRGNGLGVVVLKRLADAVRDGDHISAVIRGSAMNNDGARKVGYTAPGVDGQARVIRAALATAGVAADTVGYVEAHGTATALGDPIEVAALTQAFREDTTRAGFCGLGSLKTNVGHLDPAAGVVGLIKAALMLEHGELVPSLNFERPNPKIDFARSPFYVVTERGPWTANGHPRRAGVSSFGIGGTNVHLVLEEAPAPPPPPALPPPPYALVVSARTPDALEAATDRLAAHLAAHPELRPDDVEFTLRHGRRAFAHRRTVVGGDLAEASRALAARDPGRTWSGVADERAPSVAFLFPGQGAQHVGMGRRLYETQPVFRSEVDAGCEVLRPLLGLDLREVLYPAGADEAAAEALGRTALTQPALFVVEHALAKLWGSWGVEPDSLIGHSVGEYVAATLAGVMRRDDALALVAERGRLMQECAPGAMLAVPLAAAEVGALLTGRLALAADNGFDACVMAGPHGEVAQLEAQLAGRGVLCSRLPTSHAFHCDLMDPILEAFAARVARVRLSPPRLPFVSNLSGTWISPAEATDPGYWARHLRHTVRFAEGVRALLADERRVLLEVGPGHALSSLARRAAGAGAPRVALPSLAHPRRPEPDDAFVLGTAARLWLAGVPVDWRAGRTARRVVLPTYPFEGERYWVDPPAAAAAAPAEKRADVASWLYGVSWKRADPPPPRSVPAARWCVFADEGGFGAALAERLRAGGAEVTLVRAGARFAREGERAFVVAPASRADHEALLRALRADGAAPDGLVHAFGLDAPGGGDEPSARAFLGVLHLAQALGRVQEREARLFVLGTGVHDVTGEETLHPGQAAALGPCMVLGQEYPHLSGRYVDVWPGTAAAGEPVERVYAELTGAAVDPVVAYRGRHRWLPVFDAMPPAAAGANPVRPGGTYLITGGLGNVGLALAAALVRRGAARVALTGRFGLPDRGQWDALAAQDGPLAARVRAVRALEAAGAEVQVLRADAGDREEMRAALAAARARDGALHGVIHAAGVIDQTTLKPLAQLEAADGERQLRAKARGAHVLAELLGGERLDFVMMASSLSTVLGGLGFAAYAAANHVLDALAERQHQLGRTWWTSVAWDGWRTPDAPGAVAGPAAHAMTAEEGGEAFARLLSLPRRARLAVSTADLGARRRAWTQPAAAPAAGPEASLAQHARPDLHTVYAPPETATERRLAQVWGALLGIDRVGLDDNFFELGGSSLLAVQLVGKLRPEFAGELSVTTLFEAPTVRALSRVIDAPAERGRDLDRSQGRGRMRREIRTDRRMVDATVE